MKNKIAIFSASFLILDFLALLIFGELYSKYAVYEIINLHSLILVLIAIVSLIFINKSSYRVISSELLIALSVLYLLYSYVKLPNNVYYIIRQFMIFGYAILIYIITKNLYSYRKFSDFVLKFIICIGFLSMVIQVIYIVYLLKQDIQPFFQRYYYSTMIIMGIFIFTSYVLIFIKKLYYKLILSSFALIISFSVGHDSAYLGVIIIIFTYFFIHSKFKLLIVTGSLFCLVLIFIYFPSFGDVNVKWRLLYWKASLSQVLDNYLILGNGFGMPYSSTETFDKLNNLMISTGHPRITFEGEQLYSVAPHNSFITMLIHVGISSILLLLYPLFYLFKTKILQENKDVLFLFLSLIGISIYVFFNVILELPHTSSIFWFVYFILVYKIKDVKKVFRN